jgi:hypothetical protein
MPSDNKERHRTGRIGWLRAAVLGRERRHTFNIESAAWCRGCTCDPQQRISRGRRRVSGGGYVDGCW